MKLKHVIGLAVTGPIAAVIGAYIANGDSPNIFPKVQPWSDLLPVLYDPFPEKKGLTFVNFQTSWCGHCQRLAPTWKDLGERVGGNVDVAMIDCDEDKALCQRYGVRSYPSLLLFKDGQPHAKYEGERCLDGFLKFLGEHDPKVDAGQVSAQT